MIETIESQKNSLTGSGIPEIVAENVVLTPEYSEVRNVSRINAIYEAFNSDEKDTFWDKDERLGLIIAEMIGQHMPDGCRKTTRYKIFQNLGSGRRNANDRFAFQKAFKDVFKHLCGIVEIGVNPNFTIIKEDCKIKFFLDDFEIWIPKELHAGIVNWYSRAYMCMSVDTNPEHLPFWIDAINLEKCNEYIPVEEDF